MGRTITYTLTALPWGGIGMFLAVHISAEPASLIAGGIAGFAMMKAIERL